MNTIWNISGGKATYILRYFLPRPPMVDTKTAHNRLQELIEFCRRTNTEAVQFYVNLRDDWYYMPDSLEHATIWAEEMNHVADEMRSAGISYQLNFQDLLGHHTGGMDLRDDYSWDYLVNQNGEVDPGCPCPIGPRFRKTMGSQLEAWAATNADVIWIDDDFRLFNHGKSWEGLSLNCFCPLHIEDFSRRHNISISRSELVDAICKSGEPSWERLAWMDFMNETLVDTCSWISHSIHKISPHTRIAQMTSWADNHSVEGRNWGDFLSTLAGEGYQPITRPCFGPYSEIYPLEFLESYTLLSQNTTNTRMQYKGKIDFCPEIENTRYTRWAKSYSGMRFQLWLGQLMGFTAITLALHDLEGSPLDEEPVFEEILIRERPVLDSLAEVALDKFTTRGVALITDPDVARKVQLNEGNDINNLINLTHTWDKVLLQMGIPVSYFSADDAARQEVIALDGVTAWIPDDSQMKQFFSCGVLLDAKAAQVLIKRGYSKFIGIESVCFSDYQTGSELFHAEIIDGMPDKRMPLRQTPGNWGVLSPAAETKEVTTLVVPSGKRLPGTVIYENSLGGRVVTYAGCDIIGDEFFNHSRVSWVLSVMNWLSKESFPLCVKSYQRMLTIRRDSEKQILLAFANFSADALKLISGKLRYSGEFESIRFMSSNGKWIDSDMSCFRTINKGEYDFSIITNLGMYEWYVLLLDKSV